MTIADLYQHIRPGNPAFVIIAASPLAIGAVALAAKKSGRPGLSQTLCNLGIALAMSALALELIALLYATRLRQIDVVTDVDLLLLLLPPVLVAAALVIEYLLHPGKQERIRAQLRSGLLTVITLGVLYFILQALRFHMLIWTSVAGFLGFLALVIALLYYVVRKVL